MHLDMLVVLLSQAFDCELGSVSLGSSIDICQSALNNWTSGDALRFQIVREVRYTRLFHQVSNDILKGLRGNFRQSFITG
jgi:hypothetical protein